MSDSIVCVILLIPVALYGATVYGFTMFFSLLLAAFAPGAFVVSPLNHLERRAWRSSPGRQSGRRASAFRSPASFRRMSE